MTLVFRKLGYLSSSVENNKVILYYHRADHLDILALCAYQRLFGLDHEIYNLKMPLSLLFIHAIPTISFALQNVISFFFFSLFHSHYHSFIPDTHLLRRLKISSCSFYVWPYLTGWLDTLPGTLPGFLATIMEGRNNEIISSKHWWKTIVNIKLCIQQY